MNKKTIEILEKALKSSESKYKSLSQNITDSNMKLEGLVENFISTKKILLSKIERSIEERDKADKEIIDIKKAITILQNHEIPDWGTKENKDEI